VLPAFAVAARADQRLIEAVKNGDREAVRSLVKQGADVNAAEPDGATAIAWAAHRDDLEMAALLISAGADVNAANDYGVTPLSLACTNGSAVMVERLLKAGADPNAARPSGETPVMTAAWTGNADAVRALVAGGADVKAKENWQGQDALMWAVSQRHAAVVRVLIERGADARARSKGGFTPLLFAAQQGDLDSARTLLGAGADVNEGTPEHATPLIVAAASGQAEMTAFLLEEGADTKATDRNGATALHFAASARAMLPAVKALLAHGADPNARLVKGVRLPVDVNSVGATPFLMAAAALNADAMRALAATGADPLLTTKEGTTALMVAAGVGRFEERNDTEYKRALDAVTVAADLGVDVNAVGESGWTALHGAAYTGADAIIQYLVAKGGSLGVKDAFGQTPLSIAAAVITTGLKELAEVRPRKYRDSTVALLEKLGAPSLEASGVERLGSMAVRPD
jgi:ankyrin repeat protein